MYFLIPDSSSGSVLEYVPPGPQLCLCPGACGRGQGAPLLRVRRQLGQPGPRGQPRQVGRGICHYYLYLYLKYVFI